MSPTKLLKSTMYAVLELGYFTLFLFFALVFYTLTLLFCVLIYLVELANENYCVRVGSTFLSNFTTPGQYFSGLFALSWTTLSTVGYGNTWPALTAEQDHDADHDADADSSFIYCPGINLMLMVEAFVGVCFSGACGAILFKKVVEIQNQARVEFSHPVVIRFGSGLKAEGGEGEDEEEDEDDDNHREDRRDMVIDVSKHDDTHSTFVAAQDESSTTRRQQEDAVRVRVLDGLHNIPNKEHPQEEQIEQDKENNTNAERNPCPCLEFRIVNLQHHHDTGVIADAALSCTVGIEEDMDESDHEDQSQSQLHSPSTSSTTTSDRKKKIKRVQLPKTIFKDLAIVNDEHPHFQRVWTAMHILDENSPLISKQLRKLIQQNGGWPDKNQFEPIPEAQFIQDHLCFKEIIVSLSGMSKHTSCEVYAQKVYQAYDIVVGYKFVPVLEKAKDDDQVKVILEYIDDVTEQNGNDEPLPLWSHEMI